MGCTVSRCNKCYKNIVNIKSKYIILPCGHIECNDCIFSRPLSGNECDLCDSPFYLKTIRQSNNKSTKLQFKAFALN
jgi:hypothetical protein